jgi:hypothetical protein
MMSNSIAGAYTAMNQVQLQNQMQASVMDKALETQEQQGNAITRLLSSAANVTQGQQVTDPNVGQQIDTFA